MFKHILILALVAPLTLAITKYEACKHNGGGEVPLWVEFEGCAEAPCEIYEGDRIKVVAGVRGPNRPTKTMTTVLDAYFLGIKYPFPLPEESRDACKQITGPQCPLQGGEENIYTFEETITGIVLGQTVWLEHAAVDDNGDNYVCLRMQAKTSTKPRPQLD